MSTDEAATLGTVSSLRPFFRPNAVAVVGASRDPASIGYRLLAALLSSGFSGSVYAVHPQAAELHGLRPYRSLAELPQRPDLVVIAVPRQAVLGVVDECGTLGVPAVVVISAGFAELGAEGRLLQQQLAEKVRRHGMRLIGPNCLGVLATGPHTRLNATFVPVSPPAGRIAMSSDSGALSLALLAAATQLGLGISSCVSVGNRADVSSNDLLEYWEQDETTRVILLYLESFGNPRRFARIARRVGRCKPIVAVKGGRTRAGRRAAGSHTAALAVPDAAVAGLFQQTGVIRAETLEELLDLAAVLECQPLPAAGRVAILTNAGGPAILCADASEAAGLVLPELSPDTRRQLAAFLPATASLANPVDMIASATPDDYRRAVQILLHCGEVDALVVIYVSPTLAASGDFLQAIQEGMCHARRSQHGERTVLACLMPEQVGLVLAGSGPGRLPCFAYPEAPARVLGKLAAYARWRRQPLGNCPALPALDPAAARQVCQEALEAGGGWLGAEQTQRLLASAGLHLEGAVARSADEAVALACRFGYPVAVKLAAPHVVHKMEQGGVWLNLADARAVREAFDHLHQRFLVSNSPEPQGTSTAAARAAVLVQPMIRQGTEVMAGITLDPVFGPLVAFGLGGTYVELLQDVCFRVTPLTDRDAAEMVRSIRGWRLLQGYRGHLPADVPALEQILLRLSWLGEMLPELAELDLNPLFALPPGAGCRIVDARARVAPPVS
jgi:acyl-CoA synthetase (NDP forming)